jgi:hypothetical protein
MSGDEESPIGSVCTPTDTSKAEWSIGEMRHCLVKEASGSLFCLFWNLMLCKRYARPLRATIGQPVRLPIGLGERGLLLRINFPVTISWMLITHLQLTFVLVRFHEEASLDVEKDWEILEQL